jgi:hypothetical protein
VLATPSTPSVLSFGTVAVSGQSDVVADTAADTLTLAAGSGITITTNATTDTITITNSGTASNAFETIAVSGQSDVVADSGTDTLTLVAGTNMTITTDAETNTITFASSGGGSTNSFETIAVSGQSDVVADSSTDTLTLAAGSGITITTNATTDTITIAASGGGGGITQGTAVASTSGTTIDFSIPSGVVMINIMFNDVSTNATDKLYVQLGDSGGIETTGYISNCKHFGAGTANLDSNVAFSDFFSGAANKRCGLYNLSLVDSATNTWVLMGQMTVSEATGSHDFIVGRKSLSGELTTIRITGSDGGTFDGGVINIQYQ